MSLNGLAALAPRDWFRAFHGTSNAGKPTVLAAARITPTSPRSRKPAFDPPGQEHPVGYGPFKCRYCGRYGQPGACAGCGAPNAPSPQADAPLLPRKPDTILRCHEIEEDRKDRIDITVFGDKKRRYLVPSFPQNREVKD